MVRPRLSFRLPFSRGSDFLCQAPILESEIGPDGMTYLGVALVVLGSGLVAGALSWVTRKLIRIEALRRHHEIGSAVFLQLGVVFAVLLAFVFNEVWSEYNSAANAINKECGNLHGIAMLASTLPPAQRNEVEGAVLAYLAAVIDSEWAAMVRRHSSEEALVRFQRLTRVLTMLDPQDSTQQATRNEMLALLTQAHQDRETRLFQMMQGVPGVLWGLLISLGVVMIGFLLCFGIEYVWSQVIFTGVFAASIAFVLVMVRLFDFPFEGALRLSSSDFQITRERVIQIGSD